MWFVGRQGREIFQQSFESGLPEYDHIVVRFESISPIHQVAHDFWPTEFTILREAVGASLQQKLVKTLDIGFVFCVILVKCHRFCKKSRHVRGLHLLFGGIICYVKSKCMGSAAI